MNIKGFIFDMDGVLTETADLHFRAWRDEVKAHGIIFTKEENKKLKGLPRYQTLREILKIHNKLEDFSDEDIIKMGDHKNMVYQKMLDNELTNNNILPGIKKFLIEAKNKNIKMAVASSSLSAPKILKKLDLIKYFDFIVNPNSIKNGKPSPDIYIAAAKGIELNPEECIGFEDAIQGVKGLVESNIKSVAITWGDNEDWKIANLILTSTKELDFKKVINL